MKEKSSIVFVRILSQLFNIIPDNSLINFKWQIIILKTFTQFTSSITIFETVKICREYSLYSKLLNYSNGFEIKIKSKISLVLLSTYLSANGNSFKLKATYQTVPEVCKYNVNISHFMHLLPLFYTHCMEKWKFIGSLN